MRVSWCFSGMTVIVTAHPGAVPAVGGFELQHLAKRCGFSGARHFRDAFRRMTGMTPAEYRRRLARDRSALPRAATAPPP
ncbi:MAG: AraC family transcriptional regulator [Planctomycetes bacterium]|nr:AraC family transcriptional regulator [Planctomycetota bacterium]